MGAAAIGYFEEGADLAGVVRKLTERAGETAARVGRLRMRGAESPSGAAAEPAAIVRHEAKPSQSDEPQPDARSGSDAGQATLIDLPPARPTFVVLVETDGIGEQTGPTP
jgi:hypothetical protein